MTASITLDQLDAAIVDGYQSGFPLGERPFQSIATAVGATETTVLTRFRRLADEGFFRRVGPVLNPPVIGSSTLAAVRVPEDHITSVARFINGFDRVNHNYRRDHEWNIWFVVTAESLEKRTEILDAVAARAGPDLRLPLRTEFYIDLAFPVVNEDRWANTENRGTASTPTPVSETPMQDLSKFEAKLLFEIQDGFPLTRTPYSEIAATLGVDHSRVVAGLRQLRQRNCIKRIGGVVNHHAAGFDANAMIVWDVPAAQLPECGTTAGQRPYVTYCCERPRRPTHDWSYNLFTMIHARDRAALESRIDALAKDVLPFEHARLQTTESLKQTGVRYRDLLDHTAAVPQ